MAAMIATAVPAAAQEAPPAAEAPTKVEGPVTVPSFNVMITGERRRPCIGTDSKGEIVVCGKDNGEDVRVPDEENRTDDGITRAPDVFGGIDCKKSKCHGFGKVPPPVFYVDLKSIPEAPKGSDAEAVARGEMSDR
jgi:hypothetical protein